MKKIILILCCLTLTAAVGWAKDYHLVQTQMLDSGPVGKTPLTVYVLVMPDETRPQVFKTFDSTEMEAWLSGLSRGSIVHYDANGFLPPVLPAQVQALTDCCQKKGISFIESPVN
jgi:hypothetical protein